MNLVSLHIINQRLTNEVSKLIIVYQLYLVN
jgi:hypothetical protein